MASFDTYNRVWEHSRQRGLKKLLMLALAKHVNDAKTPGMCWPKVETLCQLTNEPDPSYIRRLLTELIHDNELVKNAGGGRGNPTVYGLLPGLDDEARTQLRRHVARSKVRHGVLVIEDNSENTGVQSTVSPGQADTKNSRLQNSVSENTVPQSTVSAEIEPINSGLEYSGLEYSVFQSLKTVDYSPEVDGANMAAQSPKVPQKQEGNSKGTHGGGDGVGATPQKTAQTPDPRPNNTNPLRHVKYLGEQGMGAAHLFADCDPDSAINDFDARRADNWTIPAIVNHWKLLPPKPGGIYERQQRHEKNQPDRPATSSGANRVQRAPRPGDSSYYDRFRKKPTPS